MVNKQGQIIPFVSRLNETEENRWLHIFHKAMPDAQIKKIAGLSESEKRQVEVAIVANPNPDELSSLSNLKWVQSLWAGVERLISELPDESIKIVRLSDPQLAITMAEAVLAWSLYLHRNMPLYQKQQQQKQWQKHEVLLPSERTISILGLGLLGKSAAKKLIQQNFNVCGWSRTKTEIEGVETFSGMENLKQVLEKSNILIILLPLTAETENLLNEESLSYLPDRASIINFARSRIIDHQALLNHLDTRHISHAVLDVFDTEPLPQTSPFWDHPSITVLPHISAPTNMKTASDIVAENINQFIDTGDIPQSVNRGQGY